MSAAARPHTTTTAPASATSAPERTRRWANRTTTLQHRALLATQMAAYVQAGMTVAKAARELATHFERYSYDLAVALDRVAARLEQGSDHATAFADHVDAFGKKFVALVTLGEATGTLDAQLPAIAASYRKEYELDVKIAKALRMPKILLVVAVLVLALFVYKIIPVYQTLYAAIGRTSDLPWLTMIFFNFSDVASSPPVLVALALVGAAAVGLPFAVRRSPALAFRVDRAKLRIPLVGRIYTLTALAQAASTIGLGVAKMGTGVDVPLHLASETNPNLAIGAAIHHAREQALQGRQIWEGLGETGLVDPALTQMIRVGEENGQLDSVLQQFVAVCEAEVDALTEQLIVWFETAMVFGGGAVVLTIMLAMNLPILNLIQNLKH
jgi:type IV pilus assembly protein PilC